MSKYHLAQINVGRPLGPMDSAVMAEFVAQLDEINALAESTPGFMWRLKDDTNNATSLRIFDDPNMLLNASVWESVEALREFVYRSAHSGVLRRRAQWFERPSQTYTAMWWIPAGHIPTFEELRERLEYRRQHGDSAFAFGFSRPFPPPDFVSDEAAEPREAGERVEQSDACDQAAIPPPQTWTTPDCGWQE